MPPSSFQFVRTARATALPPPRHRVAIPVSTSRRGHRAQQGNQDPRARRPDGMPQRHRTPPDVHALGIHLQLPHVRDGLHRERFVHLHQSVVPDPGPFPPHQVADGLDGREEEVARLGAPRGVPVMTARYARPWAAAYSWLATTSADAPSFSPGALPAVTTSSSSPGERHAGRPGADGPAPPARCSGGDLRPCPPWWHRAGSPP